MASSKGVFGKHIIIQVADTTRKEISEKYRTAELYTERQVYKLMDGDRFIRLLVKRKEE